jgi:hypothetical protein
MIDNIAIVFCCDCPNVKICKLNPDNCLKEKERKELESLIMKIKELTPKLQAI